MADMKEIVDLWRIVPDEPDYANYFLLLRDPNGWYEARVDWQGCTHFYHYTDKPYPEQTTADDEVLYLHICDIDALIARLQAIKMFAETYFTDWPGVPARK